MTPPRSIACSRAPQTADRKPLRAFLPPWAHLATLRGTPLGDRLSEIPTGNHVGVRWVQIEWGAMASVVAAEHGDSVRGSASALVDRIYGHDAVVTGDMIGAIVLLDKRLHTAAGSQAYDGRVTREAATHELACAYRGDVSQGGTQWTGVAAGIAHAYGEELVVGAPIAAWGGRMDPTLDTWMDVPQAKRLFRGALSKILRTASKGCCCDHS